MTTQDPKEKKTELAAMKKGTMWPILARREGEYFELNGEIAGRDDLVPVYQDDYVGNKAYERTLSMILSAAFQKRYPQEKLVIDHSISKGLYCWVEGRVLSPQEIHELWEEMKKLVREDLPIQKECVSLEEALKLFRENGQEEKRELLASSGLEELKIYTLGTYSDYFYGKMAPRTGIVNLFNLTPYKSGFVMGYPTIQEPEKVHDFIPQDKLFGIFEETARWDELIGVNYVGLLNEKIRQGEARTLINITEALHEKKIAYIADEIKAREDVRIILIAGPSSSGKTSFANRLGIQLRVNGLMPMAIGMDDYFLPRKMTPLKDDGTYDFESPQAMDLELFETQMKALMSGEEVQLPRFNFKTGMREISDRKVKLPPHGVLLIEGIHGLNPLLLAHVERRLKFKIYISALTVLNLDRSNRIATTDVRKLRRMARDFLSRGYSPEETLLFFPNVSQGEKKYIFPYQEEADAMFNSTLLYELSVLKKHTLPELRKIPKSSSAFEEARRLITILRLFEDIGDDLVPTNSLLREFIGGSQFYDY